MLFKFPVPLKAKNHRLLVDGFYIICI